MAVKKTEVKVLPDDTIEKLAERLVDAYQEGFEAHSIFDGVELVVRSGDTIGDVIQMYERAKAEMNR